MIVLEEDKNLTNDPKIGYFSKNEFSKNFDDSLTK